MSLVRLPQVAALLVTGALAGCTTTIAEPGGTGGESTTPTATSTATSTPTDSGTGPAQVHTDSGACSLSGTPAPITSTTLYSDSFQYGEGMLSSIINFSTGSTGGTWSEVIADQATYQPFQDYGLPAVDFTANDVLVTAATNGCGGNAQPSDISIDAIDGTPHLEVTYSLLSGAPPPSSGPCLCEFLSYYTLLAVQVPKSTSAPTICIHQTTGC